MASKWAGLKQPAADQQPGILCALSDAEAGRYRQGIRGLTPDKLCSEGSQRMADGLQDLQRAAWCLSEMARRIYVSNDGQNPEE